MACSYAPGALGPAIVVGGDGPVPLMTLSCSDATTGPPSSEFAPQPVTHAKLFNGANSSWRSLVFDAVRTAPVIGAPGPATGQANCRSCQTCRSAPRRIAPQRNEF